MPSWEDLNKAKRAEPEPDAVAERCARVFGSPEGKMLLADFRVLTIEKEPPANATDAQLRELEGERKFVRRIEKLIARGHEQMEARSRK